MAAPIPSRLPWRLMAVGNRYAAHQPLTRHLFLAQCNEGQTRCSSDRAANDKSSQPHSIESHMDKDNGAVKLNENSLRSQAEFILPPSLSESASSSNPTPDPLSLSTTSTLSSLSMFYTQPTLSIPLGAFTIPATSRTALPYIYKSSCLSVLPWTFAREPDATPPPAIRMPRAVQAAYLRPMKRQAPYGYPVCTIQFRSYYARNLEFYCDFALRAAYYLNIAARGPMPMPRILERWTVPRGHFRSKKKQENYERRTFRRLISIYDASPEAVELWLAFLRKHAYYGIGMKATMYEFAGLDVGKDMDAQMEAMRTDLETLLGQFAFKEGSAVADNIIDKINEENRRQAIGYGAPMVDLPNWKKPLNYGTVEKARQVPKTESHGFS